MGRVKTVLDLLGKPIGALGDLMKSETKKETVDPTRRQVVAGTVVAPLAVGALGGIPQKITKEIAPVAKKVVKTIPKNAFDIPIFRQAMDNEIAKEILSGKHGDELKDMAEKNLEDAIEMIDTDQDLKIMRDAYDWFRSGKEGDPPNDFAKLMDEEYSNADPNEIANVIGDSNQAGIENWRETQKLLGVPNG
jgi:hypothetical protein